MRHDETGRSEQLLAAARANQEELVADLERLVRIPSVAAEGFPAEPLLAAAAAVRSLLEGVGVTGIRELLLDGMTAPTLMADVPGPEGAPTVLVYSHYDVVPAGDPAEWDTEPFTPTRVGDAVAGRGASDSKANIVALVGALRLLGGRPPVTLRLVIEGHEEFGSVFDHYPPQAPELFAADAMLIADVGNVRPGVPTLSIALRGSAGLTVEARTLAADKHSGLFGGAAPDARLALLHALATLHDEHGDVAVLGLRREPWEGTVYTAEEFRTLAQIVDGVGEQGTGDLGSKIWSGPAITLIGFDAPPTSAPQNAVSSHAKAVLNLRVHPAQDAVQAQDALVAHLEAQRPFGVMLQVTRGETGNGFLAATDGPAFAAASDALAEAWQHEAGTLAGGGSIPIVMALDEAVPSAEKVLFGASDGFSAIHGPNERVLIDELVRTTAAMADFFGRYAQGFRA